MKVLALLFSLAATGMLLSSCASNGSGPSYADPDNLDTSSQLQEAHSRVLRQGL